MLDEAAAAAVVDGFELPGQQASKEARGMNSWFLGYPELFLSVVMLLCHDLVCDVFWMLFSLSGCPRGWREKGR